MADYLRRGALAVLAVSMPVGLVAAPLSPIVITGEVRALQAQPIHTPATGGNGPVVLRYFVPDGTEVSSGEPLLRVDPGQSASRLRSLEADIAKAEATAAKEIAELAVEAIDAELALVDAEANLGTARIDAALPRELVSALDFDQYQGELQRTEREFKLEQRELGDARDAVARRRHDSTLELKRMWLEREFYQVQLEAAEVRAERAGIVLHALDRRTGDRFDEGATSFPGLLVGEVVHLGDMAVRAYALETERPRFAVDGPVAVGFDALPGRTVLGRIEAISGAPEPRPVWGEGHYFTIDILLDEAGRALHLLPGMSARVRPLAESTQVAEPDACGAAALACDGTAKTAAAPISMEGEIIARRTAALMPPALQDVWQLNIAELVPEGSAVKAGDIVLRFEVGDLTKQLLQNQNGLDEKLREREQLQLQLAERERDEALVTAEARAALDKVLRKVALPQDAIRGIDYRKLLIERARSEKRMQLFETRERLALAQRSAERELLDVEVERLESEVARLNASIAALSVPAPIAGMVRHRNNFQGEKFAVGSQVWKGMSVAEIPDTTTLAVRASLPERALLQVSIGRSARVRIEGGASTTLPARVARIGRSVHSKSRVEPIPVVEVLLEFEREPVGVRPGQPLQVELDPAPRGGDTGRGK